MFSEKTVLPTQSEVVSPVAPYYYFLHQHCNYIVNILFNSFLLHPPILDYELQFIPIFFAITDPASSIVPGTGEVLHKCVWIN